MISKQTTLILCAVAAAIVIGGGWYFYSPSEDGLLADPSNPELVEIGRVAYARHCASCHGKNLQGETNWRRRRSDGTLAAPPHDLSGHTWHHPDKHLFDITKFGGQRNAPPGFVSRMPGFEDTMADNEIHAVLAFIKSRWTEAVRNRQAGITSRSR
jgi:mono/diheme cytochrome c family protein